jgi:hypothetical protein
VVVVVAPLATVVQTFLPAAAARGRMSGMAASTTPRRGNRFPC